MQTFDSDVVPPAERSGKLPDFGAAPAPIELPRVLMRGALAVAIGGLVVALLLGLWRARDDMREELDGAVALARAMALLAQQSGELPRAREELLGTLRRLQAETGMRHLHLQLRDAEGRALLPEPVEPDAEGPLRLLLALNRSVFAPPPPQVVSWPLRRPDGETWQLQLQASPDSEQREALETLLELLGLLGVGSVLMLAVMDRHVRRSFRPLRPLLDAIARIEQRQFAPLRSLPAMPIGELDAIAAALRHLCLALEQAEEARRAMARQVATLQEDERSRLALELHDELGQHLTALRVDAAWLQRRLVETPDAAEVAAGMAAQCARIQQELRLLLSRLRPLGAADAAGERELETVGRLQSLLETLVHAWQESPRQATRFALEFGRGDFDAAMPLPRPLVLAVYRISQEALTNVARHAGAAHALLRVTLRADPHAPTRGRLDWSVEDDGRGLDHPSAWQRGNGLAGVKERIWSAGGDLEWSACGPARASGPVDGPGPGLRLQAQLPFELPAAARLDSLPALSPEPGA